MITLTSRAVIPRSEWSIFSAPVAATRAVASIAAPGVGQSRVLDFICCSVAAVAAQVILELVIRNGAAGVGPILFQTSVKVITADSIRVICPGMSFAASDNTAIAVEFLTAPAAGNFQRVYASGYNIFI